MDKHYAEQIIAEVSRRYDAVSESFSHSRKESWPELDFLFNNLQKGEKILDIGCGNGRFCGKMSLDVDYIGVDNSEQLIKIAKENYPDRNFIFASALNLPFLDCSFDKVYAIGLIHHIPSEEKRARFLNEIRRVLKPGGTVALTVWDIWEKSSRRKKVIKEAICSLFRLSKLDIGDVLLSWQGFDDFYFHCFNRKGLAIRCNKAGLNVFNSGRLPSKGGTNIYVLARRLERATRHKKTEYNNLWATTLTNRVGKTIIKQ